MKVTFLFGGLPHYFNKVLNRINADEDIDVTVIAPQGQGATIGSGVNQTEEGISFKLVRLKEYNTWYGKPFFRSFSATINAIEPDIIVCGWPYFLAFIFNPLLLIRLKKKGIKLVSKEIPFTVPAWNESFADFDKRCVESQKDELIFKNRMAFFLLKLIRKYLYSIVFDGALLYLEQGVDTIHSYGLKKDKITVTYNSPDTEEIMKTIGAVKEKKGNELKKVPGRLIHVGRLVNWKRVDLLIRAVDRLKEKYPDINLVVIGKGEEETNLRQLVNTLGLESRVLFKGALYEGEPQTIEFLQSEVYVLAGMGGLSINEAMAHGLPVICSVADGTEKHLVFEGVNGFYFRDNDLESLVATIDRMFRADSGKMGAESQEIIRNRINIETVSALYIKALKNI